jgi:peptidoglycan-associated lipoprotein
MKLSYSRVTKPTPVNRRPPQGIRRDTVAALIMMTVILCLGGCAKKTQVAKTVPPPPTPLPLPTATLAVDPESVQHGQSVRLIWNTDNADGVSISGVGSVAASGSTAVVPDISTTYILTAAGPGGTRQASARVTVNIPPTAISQSMVGDESLFSQNVRDVFFGYDEFALLPQDKLTLE